MNAGDVKSFLGRHGLLARRDLGQNFLWDEQLAGKLVALAGVESADTVIEVGTGLGTLTRALAARAARVVTLEVDAGLVRALRAEGDLPANVELQHADVLSVDLPALVAAARPPVRLVANLPYSISAPVLRRVLDLRSELCDWSVMLQRELGQRLLAATGSRDYGSLSVLHALAVDLEKAMELSPRCFYPVPRVRSSFLRFVPHSRYRFGPGEFGRVERVVRATFSKRRKMLVNALRGADIASAPDARRALEGLGLDPRVRAEQLTPDQHLHLARALLE